MSKLGVYELFNCSYFLLNILFNVNLLNSIIYYTLESFCTKNDLSKNSIKDTFLSFNSFQI